MTRRVLHMALVALIFFGLGASLGACGRKGPPGPPGEEEPTYGDGF